MDEQIQQRKIRHRLAVLRHAAEVTGNVAATCRYYGIMELSRFCGHLIVSATGSALRSFTTSNRSSPLRVVADEVSEIERVAGN